MTEATNDIHKNVGVGTGIYTVSDAAKILQWPKAVIRRWVSGYWGIQDGVRTPKFSPVIAEGVWSADGYVGLNFLALIEIHTFISLRNKFNISLQKIRRAHTDVAKRLQTDYPFACHNILCDGRQIFVELQKAEIRTLMYLGQSGQIALKEIVEPFCKRIDFNQKTNLAERLWPLGKNRTVVIDPHHCFGRPTIKGTNTPTQVIASLFRAGEKKADISKIYEIELKSVRDAIEFEFRDAA